MIPNCFLDVTVFNVSRDIDVIGFYMFILSQSKRMPENYTKLGHDGFISYPLKFIMYITK
jgi:hypothetical protein